MTKVFIIDLDLGITVEDIVANEVEIITGESKRILDSAIEHQKALQEAKEQKITIKKNVDDTITQILDKAYDQLVKAGKEGVLAEPLLTNIIPTIPNSSAFTLRMKKMLKEKGNPYILQRKQKNKAPYYFFEPFNE